MVDIPMGKQAVKFFQSSVEGYNSLLGNRSFISFKLKEIELPSLA